MKLSTRLVLLILGCLLPILTAQIYSQVNLYRERHEQLGGLVLRQAELANADMASIIDSVRQLGALAGQFPPMRTPPTGSPTRGSPPLENPGPATASVGTSGVGCTDRLTALRHILTQYRFLALFSALDGSLLLTG